MRITSLFCAIGVCFWSEATGSQAPTAALPEALRAHLRNERLDMVTSVRGLPLGVRNGLQTLFDSDTLDIADPGAEFQMVAVTGVQAADPPAGRGGMLDRSLPRLLRARRRRAYLAGRAVSLDPRVDSLRMGRYRPARPQDNRRRAEGRPLRSHKHPEQALVALPSEFSCPLHVIVALLVRLGR